MKKRFFNILLLIILFLLSGCAGKVSNMQAGMEGEKITPALKGKSKIVFLRTNFVGNAIQSALFRIKNNNPEIIGIVAAKKKMAYDIEPGNYTFMVIGESADFMYAEVVADKTYYVDITPRMGVWKARFSLTPIPKDIASSAEFIESLESCELVISNSSTKFWASQNRESILSKYTEYYEKWISKDISSRPKLFTTDGI